MAKSYQNPIVMFSPRLPMRAQLAIMKFNILVNSVLPERLLHSWDASKSSRDYRKRIKDAEQAAIDRETVQYTRVQRNKK